MGKLIIGLSDQVGSPKVSGAPLSGWLGDIEAGAMKAGHEVARVTGTAGACRNYARQTAREHSGPVLYVVPACGRDPGVSFSHRSKAGRKAAEALAGALGIPANLVEPLGVLVDDWRAVDGLGPSPENLAAVLLAPFNYEVLSQDDNPGAQEADIGASILAVVLAELGPVKKPKKKKPAKKEAGDG